MAVRAKVVVKVDVQEVAPAHAREDAVIVVKVLPLERKLFGMLV